MFEHELKCRCCTTSLPRISKFYLPEAKPHFAPDRLIDVEHIKLEIAVDLTAKTLKGTCTTEFTAIAPGVGKLTFDAMELKVDRVLDSAGADLRFDQQAGKLVVFLRKAPAPGEQGRVMIRYEVTEPSAGLYFIGPDKDYPNRPTQLWTQGEDQDNRFWIPCHDAPNEKATTEMIVTVDEKYTAISNGKLIEVKPDTDKHTKAYHWKQAVPHASYLITLCIGEFIEITDSWRNAKGEAIPVQYLTLSGRERETRLSFGKTPKMIDFFSKSIGVDYPYEKYAQVVAWDFIYGGMENTSATTQTEWTLHPEGLEQDYSSEPLVSHELAHQWFGDLLTCKDWSHAWLNEGFATYFELLWTEHEHGKDEFLYETMLYEKLYKSEDSAAYRRPIVTNVYMSPSDLFDRHLYEKGGRVLHMLRRLVGDELWWKSINNYVVTHTADTVETIDLQRAFEEVTGKSLSWFFDQWVHRAGFPEIKASLEWVEEKKQLKVQVSQKQKEDELTPLFRLPLSIKVATADGEVVHEIELDEAEHTWWYSCAEKPKFVSLNPENTVLGKWEFDPGREMLIAQLMSDKDVTGRVYAARALAKDHSRASVDALGEALSKEQFWGVQAEICESLGKIASPRCFDYLVRHGMVLQHPKARKEAVRAIGLFRDEAAADILEKALKGDQSPLVQYEAGAAYGRARIPGIFEKLSSALEKRESWHDYYDRGILRGLAELRHDDRVLPVLLRYTRAGKSVFVRRDAVGSLSRYGAARPTLVIEQLMELARDRNYYVRLTAIDSLFELGDDRAAGTLKLVAESASDPRTRRHALVAMKAVREGKGPAEDLEKMRTDFDRLREEYRALLGRIEKLETTGKPS